MRFLGIGASCDLGAMYLRLQEEGHEVKIDIGYPDCRNTLAGLVPRIDDWRAELDWIRAAGDDGILLFEHVDEARGKLQDSLRRDGFNVIGGSAYGDRLENDRAFAQATLQELGLPVCPIWEFETAAAALAFLDSRPGRYVLKFNGQGFSSSDNYVGHLADGRDLRAVLTARLAPGERVPAGFVLMEHVSGVEMGVGAYFDGGRFLSPACLDWEHKRFFPGDLGELTGEMGTVVTYERSRHFFERTLGRMESLLRRNGYRGYINLNTIVNEEGVWPLEFTCRFGYPGFAILDPLQETRWGALLRMMARPEGRDASAPPRFSFRPGFSVGLVLTTPPFPYSRRQIPDPVGLPVLFEEGLSAADRANIHLGEVGLADGQLVTSGIYGWTMVVTGCAATIAEAREEAARRAGRIFVPNLRYRRDIGTALADRDYAIVERLGLLDPR